MTNNEKKIEINVELFGSLSSIAGVEKVLLSIPDKMHVNNVVSVLVEKFGEEMSPLLLDQQNRPKMATLVNEKYVSPAQELHDGDMVTLVPVLAGG